MHAGRLHRGASRFLGQIALAYIITFSFGFNSIPSVTHLFGHL